MHLADAFIQSDLHSLYIIIYFFNQYVEVPLGQNLETCVNPQARWYMAEGRFVALSGSQSQKFVKQRASKQREHCELGVRFRQRI